MREAVVDELGSVRRGDLVEIKFIDACRFNNVAQKHINENRVYATYKRIVGEYYGTFVDMMYGEPFFVLIVEETNGKVDVVSVPERNIQKVARLTHGRMMKEVSDAGTPMLVGGAYSKFRQTKDGIGEEVETKEEEEW